MIKGILNSEYLKKNDEEIALLAQEGDKEAEQYLLTKYQNFVIYKTKDFFLNGGDKDDLIQEGMIGLFKGIHSFKETEKTSFRGFVSLCIKRQLITAIRFANTQKNSPLNNYISFNNQSSDDDRSIEENLGSDSLFNPEEIMLSKEKTKSLEDILKKNLSDFEWNIVLDYLSGESYEDISKRYKVTIKSIYNAIERVRKKVINHVDEYKNLNM